MTEGIIIQMIRGFEQELDDISEEKTELENRTKAILNLIEHHEKQLQKLRNDTKTTTRISN